MRASNDYDTFREGPHTHPGGGLMPPYGSLRSATAVLRDRRGPPAVLPRWRVRGLSPVGRGTGRPGQSLYVKPGGQRDVETASYR